jgi:hypothetical protein
MFSLQANQQKYNNRNCILITTKEIFNTTGGCQSVCKILSLLPSAICPSIPFVRATDGSSDPQPSDWGQAASWDALAFKPVVGTASVSLSVETTGRRHYTVWIDRSVFAVSKLSCLCRVTCRLICCATEVRRHMRSQRLKQRLDWLWTSGRVDVPALGLGRGPPPRRAVRRHQSSDGAQESRNRQAGSADRSLFSVSGLGRQ